MKKKLPWTWDSKEYQRQTTSASCEQETKTAWTWKWSKVVKKTTTWMNCKNSITVHVVIWKKHVSSYSSSWSSSMSVNETEIKRTFSWLEHVSNKEIPQPDSGAADELCLVVFSFFFVLSYFFYSWFWKTLISIILVALNAKLVLELQSFSAPWKHCLWRLL